MWFILVPVLASALATVAYSYYAFRKEQEKSWKPSAAFFPGGDFFMFPGGFTANPPTPTSHRPVPSDRQTPATTRFPARYGRGVAANPLPHEAGGLVRFFSGRVGGLSGNPPPQKWEQRSSARVPDIHLRTISDGCPGSAGYPNMIGGWLDPAGKGGVAGQPPPPWGRGVRPDFFPEGWGVGRQPPPGLTSLARTCTVVRRRQIRENDLIGHRGAEFSVILLPSMITNTSRPYCPILSCRRSGMFSPA